MLVTCEDLTSAGFTLEELEDVQFMWVDSKGFYIRARKRGEDPVDLRFGFPAQLTYEKDGTIFYYKDKREEAKEMTEAEKEARRTRPCRLYTSPSPRDQRGRPWAA